MANMNKKAFNHYSSVFTSPTYNHKHLNAQVNGETQQSQSLIILERETRKNS